MTFTIKDVKGDGSCFYRSLFAVLKHNNDLLDFNKCIDVKRNDEEAFVQGMRSKLSEQIKKRNNKDYIKDLYVYLYGLDKENYDAITDAFPDWFQRKFHKMPSTLQEFRNIYSTEILKKTNWAFQPDIELTRAFLKKCSNLRLEIINNRVPKKYSFQHNTLYVLNLNENHYNAVLVKANGSTIQRSSSQSSSSSGYQRPYYKSSSSSNSSVATPVYHIRTKSSTASSKSTPKMKTKTTEKPCSSNKILNPKTNRCVLRNSCKGFEIQLDKLRLEKI